MRNKKNRRPTRKPLAEQIRRGLGMKIRLDPWGVVPIEQTVMGYAFKNATYEATGQAVV